MRIQYLPVGGLLLIGCVTEPSTATITFCAGQVVGGRVAIRNDSRSFGLPEKWTMVDAPDGKTFSFSAPRRLSIAFTEGETSNASNLRMFQLTADELSRLNCLATGTGASRIYTGSISGLGTGRTAQVGLGTGIVSRGNGNFTLQNLGTGAADLVALMRSGTSVEKFIVRRDLDLLSGAVISPIDFAGAEGGAPRLNTGAVSGAGTGAVSLLYRVVSRGTNVGIPIPVSNGILTLASMPANLQTAADAYVLGASTSTFGAVSEGRGVSVRFVDPTDRLLTLGPSLPVPSPAFTATTGPSSVRVTLPVQSAYPERVDVTVNQETGGSFLGLTMTMTRAYRGASSEWNFETPNPSALTLRAVQLDPNAFTTWLLYASSGEFSSLFLGTTPAETTVREAFVDGAVGTGPIYHSRITNSYPERLCLLCSRTLPF